MNGFLKNFKFMGFYMYLLIILKMFFISILISFSAQAGLCLRVEGRLISFDQKVLKFRTTDGDVDILQSKISADRVKALKKKRYNFKRKIKECFPLDSVIYGNK